MSLNLPVYRLNISTRLNQLGFLQNTEPMKTTTIHHDGFARVETVRQKATGECAWCGSHAKFRYGTLRDDRLSGRADMQRMVFCGRSCERSFNL